MKSNKVIERLDSVITESLPDRARVVSVTSGKGGVGKSNLVANLAIGLAAAGRRILILDADLGLANIDLLFGLAPVKTIDDVLRGSAKLSEILLEAYKNVYVLPASSGVAELVDLDPSVRYGLLHEIESLDKEFDVLLLDTAAGISKSVLAFNGAADEIIIVTTIEPTAIIDAYATIKVLRRESGIRTFSLIANDVSTAREGLEVYRRLGGAVDRFMDIRLDYLGYVLHDENLERAVKSKSPLMEIFPDAPASKCITRIVETMLAEEYALEPRGDVQFFWKRLLNQEAESMEAS
ncbi:MAG: MinD/ParA family protein [Deltaproteobacteria bacterium]|nr:MinD/ParA family protein [Deltaproteobacteria bacterium]